MMRVMMETGNVANLKAHMLNWWGSHKQAVGGANVPENCDALRARQIHFMLVHDKMVFCMIVIWATEEI